MAVSCEISRADWWLFGLSYWLSMKPSTAARRTRSAAAHGCQTIILLVLWILFSRLVDVSKFLTLVRKITQQPSCTIPFWQIEVFNQNSIFLWNFHDFVYFFIARQHTDARYWYSNSARPSVRCVPFSNDLERPQTQISRSITPFFHVEYLRNS